MIQPSSANFGMDSCQPISAPGFDAPEHDSEHWNCSENTGIESHMLILVLGYMNLGLTTYLVS